MKRILFFFLPFLPYLASAQVAKDTVTVLTIAQIPAGAIRDTTNFTFVQDNAFKKATFDSLYKYTRVKLLAASAITSAELANALSGETGTGAAVFATSPMLTTPNLGTPSAATLTNATGLPIATGLTGLGGANHIPYATSATAMTTGAGLTFDGTNFATTGTASATKLIPTGGSATGNGMYLPATNTLGFSTNGTNKMTLDASGGLGIGYTNPSFYGKLAVNGALYFGNTSTTAGVLVRAVGINNTTVSSGTLWADSAPLISVENRSTTANTAAGYAMSVGGGSAIAGILGIAESTSQASLGLYTGGSGTVAEKMRITSGGDVGIGTTPAVQFHTTGAVRFAGLATSGTSTYTVKADATGNLWYDSSDESYKKNISAIPYGIAAVMQLNPVAYNFVEDDEPDLGFIAQDIYNIIPELTYTAQDGKFGVKYDKLVSVLTKAIQEQQAQIEQLKQRITQLENK